MAVGYGLTGKVRGKIGSQVYRIETGKQVISEYNPSKSGTPTDKQIEARGKMACATAFSRHIPFELIAGFSSDRAKARKAFMSGLLNAATVEVVSDEEQTASIDYSAVKFSNGVPVVVMQATVGRDLSDTNKLFARMVFPTAQNVASFLFIAVPVNDTTEEVYDAVCVMSQAVDANGRATATLVLSPTTTNVGAGFICYAVPFVVDTASRRAVYEHGLILAATEGFTTEVSLMYSRANISKASYYLGRIASI